MMVSVVLQVYYPSQFPLFYAARFSSAPSEFYEECNMHALRHVHDAKHIGLTLGGIGDAERMPSGCFRTSELRGTFESGMYADAGHAQPGPSTGGYTVELGSTTLHVVSGQHHATTLGTSDSESYEVSRAVTAPTLPQFAAKYPPLKAHNPFTTLPRCRNDVGPSEAIRNDVGEVSEQNSVGPTLLRLGDSRSEQSRKTKSAPKSSKVSVIRLVSQ